jgi:hypothetical protein
MAPGGWGVKLEDGVVCEAPGVGAGIASVVPTGVGREQK